MDSPGVQIKLDPVAPPEAPKSRDVAPGKKRDDQGETQDAAAAAAALTVSFADILRSKRQDIKTGAEEREKTDPLLKTKAPGQKEGEEALLQANGQLAAGRKRLRQPAIEVQAKETLDHAKELAGAAMKAAAGKALSADSQDAGQSAESDEKGSPEPCRGEPAEGDDPEERQPGRAEKGGPGDGVRQRRASDPPRRDRRHQVDDGKGRGGAQESLGRRGGPRAAEAQDRQIGQGTTGLCDARHSRRRGEGGPGRFVGGCDEAGICRPGRGPAGQAGCSGFDEKTGGNGRYKSRSARRVRRRRNVFRFFRAGG